MEEVIVSLTNTDIYYQRPSPVDLREYVRLYVMMDT